MILKILFYLPAVLAIAWEMCNITETREIRDFLQRVKEKNKEKKASGKQLLCTILILLYAAWCFVGLFSSQWVLFSLIIILGFIPKELIWWRKIDAVLSFLILIFIVINAFHLHINLLNFIIHGT
jgi:uncharacterized membrane protein